MPNSNAFADLFGGAVEDFSRIFNLSKEPMFFRDEYGWASNFYLHAPFVFHGVTFKTSEHFYQMFKTDNMEWAARILNAPTPADARKLGKECPISPNWNKAKAITTMATGLELKFSHNKEIFLKLLDTKNLILVEGNFWHDNFWGDCHCNNKNGKHPECLTPGKNMLGKLLMNLRSYHSVIDSLATAEMQKVWRM